MDHYNNFNLLRLLAALQVVYSHSLQHLQITNEYLLVVGSLLAYFPGVPVFFLISGYLIAMSYNKNSNIKEYAKNRILRIYPGLYVSFVIGLIILWYFGQFTDVNCISVIVWIAAQLTFFQFYNPEFIRDFGVGVLNGSLWTISVELVFYIFLPFLYIYLHKDFYKRFFLLMLISLAFYFYMTNISTKTSVYEKLISVSIFPYLFYFLIGIYMYVYENVRDRLKNRVFVFALLYGVIVYFDHNDFFYLVLQQLMLAFFIFSFAFSYPTMSYKIMKHHDITYGVYIYHMLIVNVFVHLELKGGEENLIYVLILSLLAGMLSYFFIEKPFLRLKKRSLYHEIS